MLSLLLCALASVDLELKRQFQELQIKVMETRAKMKQIDATIEVLNRQSQKCRVTLAEVQSLKDEITYKSVGRMFVKTNHDEIIKDLEAAIKLSGERKQELEKNKDILEKSLKDKENNLREIISQKQQNSS